MRSGPEAVSDMREQGRVLWNLHPKREYLKVLHRLFIEIPVHTDLGHMG